MQEGGCATLTRTESSAASAAQAAKQGAEVGDQALRGCYPRAEPWAWIARMLAALEQRVNRGSWPIINGAIRLLWRTGVVLAYRSLRIRLPILLEVKPPTGEPCAGNPHARFGGRGGANQCTVPTPIIGNLQL